MIKTIVDPITFQSEEVDIDDLADNLAITLGEALSRFHLSSQKTVAERIYKKDGSISIGLLVHDRNKGENSKKYRITIERMAP